MCDTPQHAPIVNCSYVLFITMFVEFTTILVSLKNSGLDTFKICCSLLKHYSGGATSRDVQSSARGRVV